MSNHLTFNDGQRLRYIGKGFENFDSNQPYMIFLGYDSSGWNDMWVSYNGEKMRMTAEEVEKAED